MHTSMCYRRITSPRCARHGYIRLARRYCRSPTPLVRGVTQGGGGFKSSHVPLPRILWKYRVRDVAPHIGRTGGPQRLRTLGRRGAWRKHGAIKKLMQREMGVQQGAAHVTYLQQCSSCLYQIIDDDAVPAGRGAVLNLHHPPVTLPPLHASDLPGNHIRRAIIVESCSWIHIRYQMRQTCVGIV